jgi:UDP-N-acetylglucosamine 3-dehydrogenase
MTELNIGLIGLGYIGKTHIYNCLHLEGVKLAAVADISKNALNKAKRIGVPNTYTDYQELLNNPQIDAVIIALPTHLHAKCAIAAAEARKHILLEKPIARSTAEATEILSKARSNNVKIMIGYPLQFSAPFITLKNKIDSGQVGEIQTAYTVNINSGPFIHRAETGAPSPVPDWWWKKDSIGGGALMDLGSHMINLAQWYFGDVVDAKSYLGYRYNMEHEDHAIALLKFKTGQMVTVNVGWYSGQTQMQFDAHGTCGKATASLVTPSKIKTVSKLLLRKTPPYFVPFHRELERFVECITNDVQPAPSGEDGLKDLQAIELAYKNSIKM